MNADDRDLQLVTGERIDTAKPWPLPADAERNLLALAHAKSSRRFAAVPVPPTGFADLEDTPCTA